MGDFKMTTEQMLRAAEDKTENVEILESETETVQDFLRDVNIQMHVLPIHENPYRHPGDQGTAYHYSCKLINDKGQWFVIYFSKGPGLRLWQAPPDEFESSGKPLHVPVDSIGTPYDGPLPPFEDEHGDQMVYEKCSIPAPPRVDEVLDCIANDCYTIEVAGIFEGWCMLMRASIDSLHSKKTFETCSQHRLKLQALLGSESYHRLIHEMGRKVVLPKETESEETD